MQFNRPHFSAHSDKNFLFRLGVPVRKFYRVPMNLDKPVGSRVLPDFESKRSGAVYGPGAVVEIIQEVEMDGVTYLRTEDKKGWLFAYHPKLDINMLEAVPGQYFIETATFRCMSTSGKVPIRDGPSLLSKGCDDAVYVNEDIDVLALWIPNDSSNTSFLKLSGGKGWVQQAGSFMQASPLFEKI